MSKQKTREEKVLIPADKDTLMSFFTLPGDIDSTTLSQFIKSVLEGFHKGAKEHGENGGETKNLFDEIKEELRDTCCYCYLQYQKLLKLEGKYQAIEGLLKEKEERLDQEEELFQ